MQKSGVSVEPDGFSGPAHVNPSGISHVSFYHGSQWAREAAQVVLQQK